MEDCKKRSVRKWATLEEELEALRNNPVCQALLRDVADLDPERQDALMSKLTTMEDGEEGQENGH